MDSVIQCAKVIKQENNEISGQVKKAQKKATMLQVKVSKQNNEINEMTNSIKMISKSHAVELNRKDRAIARVAEKN